MINAREVGLKDKLRERNVGDREALPYFIIFYALTAAVGAFPLIEEFNEWDAASGVLSVFAAIGGVLYTPMCKTVGRKDST